MACDGQSVRQAYSVRLEGGGGIRTFLFGIAEAWQAHKCRLLAIGLSAGLEHGVRHLLPADHQLAHHHLPLIRDYSVFMVPLFCGVLSAEVRDRNICNARVNSNSTNAAELDEFVRSLSSACPHRAARSSKVMSDCALHASFRISSTRILTNEDTHANYVQPPIGCFPSFPPTLFNPCLPPLTPSLPVEARSSVHSK